MIFEVRKRSAKEKVGYAVLALAFLLFVMAAAISVPVHMAMVSQGQRLYQEGYEALAMAQYDLAIGRFRAALKKPIDSNLMAFALEEIGFCEDRKGLREDAMRDYNEALQLKPDLAFSHGARGRLYDIKGKRDEAFKDYSNAIRVNPNDGQSLYFRGMIYMQRRDWEDAVADFSETIRATPSAYRAFFERGLALFEQKEMEKAIANFDAAIELWPGYAAAYVQRGYVFKAKHEAERAMRDFAKAIEIDPKFERGYRARAYVYSESKRWPEAISEFTEAISRSPKDLLALEGRGFAFAAVGDFDSAIRDYKKMNSVQRSAATYKRLADVYDQERDYPSAAASLRAAVTLAPQRSVALDNLAWFLATCPDAFLRNGKEAVMDAAEACRLTHSKDGYSFDVAAAAAAETGNFDAAMKYEHQAFGSSNVKQKHALQMEERLKLYERHQAYRQPVAEASKR